LTSKMKNNRIQLKAFINY